MAHRKDSPVLEAWHNYIWPSLAFIVVLLVLPFLAPFLLIMWTYRKWLTNQLAHRRPDIEIMKETDAIWFQNAETNMAIINSLWFLKGTVNPTTLVSWQRHLDSRIASAKDSNGNYIYPKMRCTMKSVWHRYVWFPIKDFDIADYVTQCEETPRNLTELETLLGRLSSAPFPDDKAQWKMEIIPFHDGEYICILRVHHAIGDGGALVKMTMASMVDEEVPLARAPPKLFGTKTKLKKILQAVFTTPMMLINLLLKTFDLNALHGPKLCGDKLVAWSHNLDLDFIKKMKTAGNCTVNDVLMSCLAMAFQAYFRRNCSVCPKGIRCSVPVDMRAHKPGDRTLDNQFALVFLELPLNENGPMETLKVSHHDTPWHRNAFRITGPLSPRSHPIGQVDFPHTEGDLRHHKFHLSSMKCFNKHVALVNVLSIYFDTVDPCYKHLRMHKFGFFGMVYDNMLILPTSLETYEK